MAERNREEEHLTCSICLGIFNEPKLLPCLHRFCEACLHQTITSAASAATGNKMGFPCPCCRDFTSSPNPKRPRSEWAALFKTDFLIKDMVSLRSSNMSETKHRCPTHTDTECDYYCVDCSQVLCDRCEKTSHRRCKHVVTLAEAAADRRATLMVAQGTVRTQIEQATQSESLCDTCTSEIERQKNKVAAEIATRGQELRLRIEQEESQLLRQLNEKCHILTEKVNSNRLRARAFKNEGDGRFEAASSKLCLPNIDIMLDDSVLDITRECQQFDISQDAGVMDKFCAHISNTEINFRKTSPLTVVLGNIVTSHNVDDSADVDEVSQVNDRNREGQTDSGNSSVGSHNVHVLTTFDMNITEDVKTAYISDIIVVAPDNAILVTDMYNKCLKLFKVRRGISQTLFLEFPPSSLKQLSNTTVAVCLPFDEQIALIKITPYLHVQRYIETTQIYYRIATLDSSTLVATSLDRHARIDTIDLYGQVSGLTGQGATAINVADKMPLLLSSVLHLCRHSIFLESFTNNSNSDMEYLCVTPDTCVLLSKPRDHCLMCISQDGTTKFSCPQQNPQGVACDSSGRIFLVVGNGLITLTSDGHSEQTLISPEDTILSSPRAVAVDNGGLIYVVNNGDEVKVLRYTRVT